MCVNHMSGLTQRKDVFSEQMAAPSTGPPVTVTVGVVWNLQLAPLPPRPPRLSAASAVTLTALTVARAIFGLVYFQDCPQQPNIPKYLLGMALISSVTLLWENDVARQREPPSSFKACLQGFWGLFILTWLLLGDVWIFSVYQPNYDPSAADGLYCNKTLYTFAFWNAVYETFGFGVVLAKICKGLVCYIIMSPVNIDFYRNV